MERVAHPYAAAAAVLAATGLVAAVPSVSPSTLPDAQVPAVQLTGFSDTLETLLQGLNDGVINGQLGVNDGLVSGQVGLEQMLLGTDSAFNGVLNRLYNVFNMGLGSAENWFNGVFGIHSTTGVDPAHLTWSLLVGQNPFGSLDPNVFNSGYVGGLEGMFNQGAQAFANVTGFPSEGMATAIYDAEVWVNQAVVNLFLGFNHVLTSAQIGFEEMIAPLFMWLPNGGADSLFNGALNRLFDTFNMMVDAAQQGFLGMIGANFDPVDMTSSLLTTVGHTLSDGTIGGIEGVLAQGYMAFADFVGMFGLL